MSARANLAAVAAALTTAVERQRLPVTVTLSEDGRMLTAQPEAGRVPPAGEGGVKNPPRQAPPGRSFDLSVMLRPVSERGRDQRFILPTQATNSLELEGDAQTGMWTLQAGPGEEVVVRLARGQAMNGEEAEELLKTIEPALASLRGGEGP